MDSESHQPHGQPSPCHAQPGSPAVNHAPTYADLLKEHIPSSYGFPSSHTFLLLYFISFLFFLQDKTIRCEIHFVLLEAVPHLTLPETDSKIKASCLGEYIF